MQFQNREIRLAQRQETSQMSNNSQLPVLGGPPETLLSQYKKCTVINNEQLRNARNLEEVVKIKVQAIDGNLGNNPMQLEDPQSYDFKFDPIHFRQKVPCMADRNFLIN